MSNTTLPEENFIGLSDDRLYILIDHDEKSPFLKIPVSRIIKFINNHNLQ